jgi:hypothetical protein
MSSGIFTCTHIFIFFNLIDGATVSVLTSSEIGVGFEPQSGQSKGYKIGICFFSATYAALRSKNKDYMVGSESG